MVARFAASQFARHAAGSNSCARRTLEDAPIPHRERKRLDFKRVHGLAAIAPTFADELEIEELVLYAGIAERLRDAGLTYRTAYTPPQIPPEQV